MSKDIAVLKDKSYSLQKISDMTSMANVLKEHVIKQELFTKISGKNYVHVEGWQFAGGLMGLFPKVVSIENLSNSEQKEVKWRANVEILDKDGKVVSNGFAICSNKEDKKKNFDEYSILSMAQTRAIGKAYRNIIGWVMKLAGYEATPAEEMKTEEGKKNEPASLPEISEADIAGIKKEIEAISATHTSKELTAVLKNVNTSISAGDYNTVQVEYLKVLSKKVGAQFKKK